MINIKNKAILMFSVIVIILLVSFVITALGYSWIMDAVNNIDVNKERISSIQEIRGLLFKEQHIVANSIINSDSSEKEELARLNSSIKTKAQDLLKDSSNLEAEDIEKLKDILDINEKYGSIFNEILSAIEQSKKEKLLGALKAYSENCKAVLENEQKLKDSIYARIDYQLKEAALTYGELESLHRTNTNAAESIEKAISQLKIQLDSLGFSDDVKSTDAKQKDIEDSIKTLKALIGKTKEMSGANFANAAKMNDVIDKIKVNEIQKDFTALSHITRVIYWTQRKQFNLTEAVAYMDESKMGSGEAEKNMLYFCDNLKSFAFGSELKMLEDIVTSNTGLDKAADIVLAEIKKLNTAELAQFYMSTDELTQKSNQSVEKLEKSFKTYLTNNINESKVIQRKIIIVLASIILFALLVGMLLSHMLYSVIRPIKGIISLLGRAEKGDLSARAAVNRKDEIGQLGEKVNSVLEGQQRIVGQVETATKDISTLRQKLFEVFNKSKDNVSRVSSGVKSVVKSVRTGVSEAGNNLRGALQTNTEATIMAASTKRAVDDGMKAIEVAFTGEKSVVEAEEVIRKVTDTVQKMAGTINMLEESSDKIGDITNTISDIASRTNLLALNAAIEASRAGQQGKGFAVLADEIRKLAEGSNKAAGAIKKQIAEIQDRISLTVENMNEGVQGVEEGVVKINQVKKKINEIIESVKCVVDSVKETLEASSLQTNRTEELAKVVDTITRAASEAAGTGEKIDKSLEEHSRIIKDMELLSEKLDDASDRLGSVLGQFKV